MPSPFPGMDPFLETPKLFPGFHNRFINSLAAKLEKVLPEGYFADFGERIWVEATERTIEPDVNIHQHNGGGRPLKRNASGPVAIASSIPAVVVKVHNDPRKETFLEIYQIQDPHAKLVCSIEMLSTANKTGGSKGQALYLLKQEEVLNSRTHLVEIDLLRGGKHTTAVPQEDAVAKAGSFDYHVCCHRFDIPDEFLVYPIRLQDRLPLVRIPLLGDQHVSLDFQEVFEQSYADGPYRRRINYGKDKPVPPLRPDQKKWMNKLLKDKGHVR